MEQEHVQSSNRRKNAEFSARGRFYTPDAEMFRTIRDAIRQSRQSGITCPHCERQVSDYELIYTKDSVICRTCFEEEN